MKAKCNFCGEVVYKSRDQLIDCGWNRAIISTPIKKTITACPKHWEQFKKELERVLVERKS